MSRVTKRDENGMLFVGGLSWLEVIRALTHAMSKLEQYEHVYPAPHLLVSYLDSDLGPVHYRQLTRNITSGSVRDAAISHSLKPTARWKTAGMCVRPA